MSGPHQPYSTYTAVLYPVEGVALFFHQGAPEAAVYAGWLVLLGGASAAFHWTERWENLATAADHAMVLAVVASLAVYAVGLGWVAMFMAGTAGAILGWALFETIAGGSYRWPVGFLLAVALAGGFVRGDPVTVLLGVAFMGAAYYVGHVREGPGDAWHSLLLRPADRNRPQRAGIASPRGLYRGFPLAGGRAGRTLLHTALTTCPTLLAAGTLSW